LFGNENLQGPVPAGAPVSRPGSDYLQWRASRHRADFYAVFDPAAGQLPFPTNLLFNGSTDGTLNIPVDDPAAIPGVLIYKEFFRIIK